MIFDVVKYLALTAAVCLCIWGVGKLFADSISDYEIITPKDGIECVVVSRMFNTSVDCWQR